MWNIVHVDHPFMWNAPWFGSSSSHNICHWRMLRQQQCPPLPQRRRLSAPGVEERPFRAAKRRREKALRELGFGP